MLTLELRIFCESCLGSLHAINTTIVFCVGRVSREQIVHTNGTEDRIVEAIVAANMFLELPAVALARHSCAGRWTIICILGQQLLEVLVGLAELDFVQQAENANISAKLQRGKVKTQECL